MTKSTDKVFRIDVSHLTEKQAKILNILMNPKEDEKWRNTIDQMDPSEEDREVIEEVVMKVANLLENEAMELFLVADSNFSPAARFIKPDAVH